MWDMSFNWMSSQYPCGYYPTEAADKAWYGLTCGDGFLERSQLKNCTHNLPTWPACDSLQFVVDISLPGNRLTGSFPSEIGYFSRLDVSLVLSENTLTQTIPTELGSLSNLTSTVDLSYNLLIGTIPTEMGMLTNLRTMCAPPLQQSST